MDGWVCVIPQLLATCLELDTFQKDARKILSKKTRGREIIPRTEVPIPKRTDMGILGHITNQVSSLYDKAESKKSDFDKNTKREVEE